MLWDNDTSEKDQKFQEHALPPSSHLSDAQLVGVSKAAPELSANDVAAGHGALDNAAASGGSGHAQVILPEQLETVPGFTVESVYEPAQQVGGDFFQVMPDGDLQGVRGGS